MEPRRGPDLLPPPAEQGVIDGDVDRRPRRDQQRDHQQGRGQPQVVGVPPGAGEEPVRPVVRPQPRQPGPGQHPADRPLPRLGKETAGQAAERAERRGREQRRERRSSVISDAGTMSGSIGRRPFPRKGGRGRGRPPAIMDSMPQTPDEQARNAVTARVTAHVAAGWPRLGLPEVRFRGRYCYVAVTLPGHRGPTPFLRLRWTGSPDEWAIGIYKATTEQYSENEFPWSYGPLTGTPEQGIDETLALYAGPPPRK